MKKLMILTIILSIFTACSSTPETENEQYKRLLKQAEKFQKEKVEAEKRAAEELEKQRIEEIRKNKLLNEEKKSEITYEINKKEHIDPHFGKTRGEIMQYEMKKVKEEMEVLKNEVDVYAEKEKKLKEYKNKLEKLEKLNKLSM